VVRARFLTNEQQIIDAFWYGMRSILTNQTFKQTAMGSRHNAEFKPILLIVSEIKNLPSDIMISPDVKIKSKTEMIYDLKNRLKLNEKFNNLKTKDNVNRNTIEMIEEENILEYLNNKGHIKDKGLPRSPTLIKIKKDKKKEEKKTEDKEKGKEENSESN